MMVRSSTDLPVPDPPTRPTISPRNTSKSRLSWITLSPNCVRTPRRLQDDIAPVAVIDELPALRQKLSAGGDLRLLPSPCFGHHTLAEQEDDREHRIEHDHAEDRFDHRLGRELPDALGAAADLQALEAADDGDQRRRTPAP